MSNTTTISIEVDTTRLCTYTNAHLAGLWHVAQLNPVDGFTDSRPGEIADAIGREIIRRWLASTPPELHHHQARHYTWKQLTTFARYQPGNPDFHDGHWVPRDASTDGPVGDQP